MPYITTADGAQIVEDMCFVDAGVSGATLVRPQLERLRDAAALGAIDRLYILSPDRLARKYAYQALLMEEFRRDHPDLLDRYDAESREMAKPADPETVLAAIDERSGKKADREVEPPTPS